MIVCASVRAVCRNMLELTKFQRLLKHMLSPAQHKKRHTVILSIRVLRKQLNLAILKDREGSMKSNLDLANDCDR